MVDCFNVFSLSDLSDKSEKVLCEGSKGTVPFWLYGLRYLWGAYCRVKLGNEGGHLHLYINLTSQWYGITSQEFNNPNTRILQADSFSVTLKVCRISETKRTTGYDKTTRFFRQIGKIDPIKYKFSESYNQLDNSKLGSTQQQKIC